MLRTIVFLAFVAICLATPARASAQATAEAEVNRLLGGMPTDPFNTDTAARLIALRPVSVRLILVQLDGQLQYMKSARYQRDYAAALMMQPPVRRGGQWVQPMVLPMNPANKTFVALCAVLTAMGETAAVPRINDGLMYNQTLSVYAGEVLRAYRARLLAR